MQKSYLISKTAKGLPRRRIDVSVRNCPKKVAECADGVVRDRPVHRWARGARARRPCAASKTPSASSTPAEGLRCEQLPALQHPACPLDVCVRRNRQARTSTRTLRAGTREVAQRAQSSSKEFTACHLQCCRARNWQPRTFVDSGAYNHGAP